jgi:hypothetical protein
MEIELKDREGNWFIPDFTPTPEELDKWTKEGRVRALNKAPAEPAANSEQSGGILGKVNNALGTNITGLDVAETAADFLFPVSSANARRIIDDGGNPDSWRYMPSMLGSGLADGALMVVAPIRAGITAVKAARAANTAGRMITKAVPQVSGKTGQIVAHGAVGAADNVANTFLTNKAVEVAGDTDVENEALGYAISGGIGGILGGRHGAKMLNAQGELVSSMPSNIRLNEEARKLWPESDLRLGNPDKNEKTLNAFADMAEHNPRKSVQQLIDEKALEHSRISQSKPGDLPEEMRILTDFIPEPRNMQSKVSDAIDESRTSLLQDMVDKGYLDYDGLNASKLDEIREFLNNSINWNKNQQGLARSASDEKAARELYDEINKAMDKGGFDFPYLSEVFGEGESLLKGRRDWDRAYSKNKTESKILSGVQGVRAKRDAKTGDYYPFKNINPSDYRNLTIAEYLALLSSQRMPMQVYEE